MGLSKGSLAGGNSIRGRVENDYYATPESATRLILNEVSISGSILEPACGEGHISNVLRHEYGLDNVTSSDIVYRGYGIGDIDFLSGYYEDNQFDSVITNPPFKYAKEFIEESLRVSKDKVVMFAKLSLLESTKRKTMFENTPLKFVYVHSSRQHPMRNGSPYDDNGKKLSSAICFAWFVWEHGYEGEPIIRFLD